jgi:chemotaxis signal transduction protein
MSASEAPIRWEELARSAAAAVPGVEDPALLRQLLTFSLDGSPYALPVERVREIVQVVDPRRRLGLSPGRPGRSGRIVIVLGEDGQIGGLLVDAVTEVLSVTDDALQPPTGESAAVAALCARGERFVSVVDLDKLWTLDAEY